MCVCVCYTRGWGLGRANDNDVMRRVAGSGLQYRRGALLTLITKARHLTSSIIVPVAIHFPTSFKTMPVDEGEGDSNVTLAPGLALITRPRESFLIRDRARMQGLGAVISRVNGLEYCKGAAVGAHEGSGCAQSTILQMGRQGTWHRDAGLGCLGEG